MTSSVVLVATSFFHKLLVLMCFCRSTKCSGFLLLAYVPPLLVQTCNELHLVWLAYHQVELVRQQQAELKRKTSRERHAKFKAKGLLRASKVGAHDETEVSTDDKNHVAADNKVEVAKDMTKVKWEFIRDFVAKSGLPPSQERRSAALKAWMESSERAAFQATRVGAALL